VTPFIIIVAGAVVQSPFKKLTVAQLFKNFPSLWKPNFHYRVQESGALEHFPSPFMAILKLKRY
jgi:hypothetical protein